MLILLDDLYRAQRRSLGIEPGITLSLALAEQVPILVKPDLEHLQPRARLVAKSAARYTPQAQDNTLLLRFPIGFFEYPQQLRAIRLYPRNAQLCSGMDKLWQFFNGLLPDGSVVKRGEFLEFVLGELFGIDGNHVLLEALPTQVFRHKCL